MIRLMLPQSTIYNKFTMRCCVAVWQYLSLNIRLNCKYSLWNNLMLLNNAVELNELPVEVYLPLSYLLSDTFGFKISKYLRVYSMANVAPFSVGVLNKSKLRSESELCVSVYKGDAHQNEGMKEIGKDCCYRCRKCFCTYNGKNSSAQ